MDPQLLLTQKQESHPNLQSLIDAGQLNQWMVQLIRPYLKGNVLEIWSGEGDISTLFVQNGQSLRISDPHRANCATLKQKFEGESLIKGVHRVNLYDPEFDTTHAKWLGTIDTVLSMNAVEQDSTAPAIIKNAKKLLRERGRLILLVAARTVLYEESDEGYLELRRYNRKNIKDILGAEGKIIEFFSVSEIAHYQQIPFFLVTGQPTSYHSGLYIIATARK